MTATTHGRLVADKGVYPDIKKIASKAGWSVKSLPDHLLDNVSDESIAKLYGKGRCILLTHDKTAYKDSSREGFAGYIVFDGVYEKTEYNEFLKYFKEFMTVTKAKNIVGYQYVICKDHYTHDPLRK